MANSADSDQLVSSEANWSGSTLFAKQGISRFSRTRVKFKESVFYLFLHVLNGIASVWSNFVFCFCLQWKWNHTIWHVYCICSKYLDSHNEANSEDPDQTALEGAVWSQSALFAILTVRTVLTHHCSLTLRLQHKSEIRPVGEVPLLEKP